MKINKIQDPVEAMINDMYAEKVTYEFAKKYDSKEQDSIIYSSLWVRVRKDGNGAYTLIDAVSSNKLSDAVKDYESSLIADKYVTAAYYIAILCRIHYQEDKPPQVTVIESEAFEN